MMNGCTIKALIVRSLVQSSVGISFPKTNPKNLYNENDFKKLPITPSALLGGIAMLDLY